MKFEFRSFVLLVLASVVLSACSLVPPPPTEFLGSENGKNVHEVRLLIAVSAAEHWHDKLLKKNSGHVCPDGYEFLGKRFGKANIEFVQGEQVLMHPIYFKIAC